MAGERLRVTGGKASGTEISFEDEFLIGRATTGDGPARRGSRAVAQSRQDRPARGRSTDDRGSRDPRTERSSTASGSRRPRRCGPAIPSSLARPLFRCSTRPAPPRRRPRSEPCLPAGATHSGCGHPAARARRPPRPRPPRLRRLGHLAHRPPRRLGHPALRPPRRHGHPALRRARHGRPAPPPPAAATAPRGTLGRARGRPSQAAHRGARTAARRSSGGRSLAAHRRRRR